MPPSQKYAPIRRGIALALVAKSSEVLGHILISGLLAERLRAYFGTGDTEEGDADLSQSVDDGFIKLAFRGVSGEASMSLSDMGIEDRGDDVLYIQSSVQIGRGTDRITGAGLFSSEQAGRDRFESADIDTTMPSAATTRSQTLNAVPMDMEPVLKNGLRKLLRAYAAKPAKRPRPRSAEEGDAADGAGDTGGDDATEEAQQQQQQQQQEEEMEVTAKKQRLQSSLSQLRENLRAATSRFDTAAAAVRSAKQEVGAARIQMVECLQQLKDLGEVVELPSPVPQDAADPAAVSVHYVVEGVAGMMSVRPDQPVFLSDLEDGYVNGPPTDESEDDKAKRSRRGCRLCRYGCVEHWVPAGVSPVPTNVLGPMKTAKEQVDRLLKLFDGKQCKLSDQAMRYITGFALHGYGASDEAVMMIVSGVIFALRHEMGMERELTTEMISKGCPNSRTLSRHEHNMAADCLVRVLQMMKDDGATTCCVFQDHSNRKGQEHYVKGVSWMGECDGRPRPRFFLLDVDSCGHTAAGCA